MANNYKIKMKDIQNKYKFKIFCAGYEYDDTEIRNEISQRALISEAGRYVELELNPNTYVLTAKLKDKNNNVISTSSQIDLPLESMIVDCDYDATTKSLIITLQNGNTTSIPLGDLIDGLATEEDLNAVRDNLEVVQNELNQYKTIYNVLPKVEDEGEAFTLNDTGNATLKMDLKGNTSQDGTPTPESPQAIHVVSGDNEINVIGKNLLGFENGTYTNNQGTTAIVENGKITLSGTGTANPSGVTIPLTNSITIPSNTTYTLSAFNNSTNSNVSLRLQAVESSNPYTNVTLSNINANATLQANEQYKVDRLYIRCNQGTTLSNFIIQPQIEKGSSATTYEPYIGNTYPIYLGVENLFDKDNMNVLNASVTSDVITSNVNAKMFYIPCKPNTTYTISREIVGARFVAYTTATTPTIGLSVLQNVGGNTDASITITTNASANYLMVYYLYNASEDETKILSSIQVEKGSKKNSYSEYGVQPIELCKIGNYQDSIVKDNGKWFLHKEIEKVVFDGSESGWSSQQMTNNYAYQLYIGDMEPNPANSALTGYLANLLSELTPSAIWGSASNTRAFAILTDKRIRLTIGDATDKLNDFKTFLSNNNLLLYYVLATPTTTEITDSTLISQLETLRTATSYDNQTNISQTNDDLPFIISASALYDLNNLVTRVAILETE